MITQQTTRVLILGGGFGGVTVAQQLARRFKGNRAVEITLINRDNYFVFVPLLASAAAGSIESLHVVAPIRRLLKKGVQFRAEEITGIDLQRRLVATVSPTTGRERELPYDHLVIALGNVINLARLPGVAQHGKTLKTLGDALAIRNHVLQMLEAADIETDPAMRREMLTFVVAGGGFSGVEMVGELNDMVHEVIRHYPAITREQVCVILLHSNDRILPELSVPVADYALKQLRRRGVEVRLGVRLAGATPHEALLEGGDKIPTRTLIVAAGSAPPPVIERLRVQKDRGKIVVDEYMQVPGQPGLWALGDNAAVPNAAARDGAPSPPTAQFAVRQGKTLAHNIAAAVRGGHLRPFAFNGLGQLCLVGHGKGVGELRFGFKPKGFLGWFLWRGVYWSKMPSFGRKVQVGTDWFLNLIVPRELAQFNLSRTQTVGRAHYREGEVIFRQGDPGDHFYLITDGAVEVIRERATEEGVVLARLGKGDYFGETALLTRGRRNATIRCVTPVDVITLTRDDFASLAGTWLQLADHLRAVSDRRAAQGEEPAWMPHAGSLPFAETAASVPPPGPPQVIARLLRADSGGEIVLDRDLISLGRSTANHIVVPDPLASRRHALIQRDGEGYWLEDLGGTNGTWLNGARVTERAALTDGDRIRIGRTQLTFRLVLHGAVPASGAPSEPLSTGPLPELDRVPAALTAVIRSLDEPSPADRPGAPEDASITRVIGGLDAPAGAASAALPASPAGRAEPALPPPIHAGAGAPPVPRLSLRVTAGPANGVAFEVGAAGATLGRARENDLCILDERLSRAHARIEFAYGAYFLSDLGSTNGTLVNGARLTAPHPLRTGDVIELGTTRLVVAVLPAAAG